MNLISIQEALDAVLNNTKPGANSKTTLKNIQHNYLAEDVIAPIDLPGFDNSAMDGYVFRYEDYENGNRTFTQTGKIKAGDPLPSSIAENCCYRIFTGAAVPDNGSLVIMQEHISINGNQITIEEEGSKYFQNIRKRGEQETKGKVALEKGTYLSPAAIGYLSSLGITEVETIYPPKVSILTTGNELVQPGTELKSGQIYESNSGALMAGFKQFRIDAKVSLKVNDEYELTKTAIKGHLENNDFLVLTGGISVGDYDFVGKALIELGVEQAFYKVNQKPGKPFFFGKTDNCLVFALPGNPAAVMTCFYYYLQPAIRKFMGASNPTNLEFNLPLLTEFYLKGSRDVLLKAIIENGGVNILDGQSSNMMHTFAHANGIVQLQATKNEFAKGEMVRVFPV